MSSFIRLPEYEWRSSLVWARLNSGWPSDRQMEEGVPMATGIWVLVSQRIWTDLIRRRIVAASTLCDIAERQGEGSGAARTRTTLANVRRNLTFARVQLHKPAYVAKEKASELEELCSRVDERVKRIESSLSKPASLTSVASELRMDRCDPPIWMKIRDF